MKRNKFIDLLERRGLTQEKFAKLVEKAWLGISGRPLSRQAVNAWVNGHAVPRFSPIEALVVIEILGCTLTELALAFPHEKESQEKHVNDNECPS